MLFKIGSKPVFCAMSESNECKLFRGTINFHVSYKIEIIKTSSYNTEFIVNERMIKVDLCWNISNVFLF